jgi:hypothetical protein
MSALPSVVQLAISGCLLSECQVRVMSALPPKADIGERNRDVRFVPIADIAKRECQLHLLFFTKNILDPAIGNEPHHGDHRVMPERRFPPPWSVEEQRAWFRAGPGPALLVFLGCARSGLV